MTRGLGLLVAAFVAAVCALPVAAFAPGLFCSVLQFVCCSVLQCVVMHCSVCAASGYV